MMRLMTRAITTVAVMYSVTLPHASAQAAAHANYSATWVLDPAKSEASTALPSAATWTVTQRGDTITVDRETTIEGMGVVKAHIVVGIDGKPWKNTVSQPGIGDVETSTVASWDKDVLVMVTSGNIQGTDFVQTDRWTLGADGKTMVSRRSVTVEGNEVQSATFAFVKKN